MIKFPEHGKICCQDCFPEGKTERTIGKWRMRNDPGAWGSRAPRFLVLGFSKGATQADIYESGDFDKVAFGGSQTRDNLTRILQTVGLLSTTQHIDRRIQSKEMEYHFGSLIRCSLARINESKSERNDREVYETSGAMIIKSFSEIPGIIRTCSLKYLASLPPSLKAVLVLGTDNRYIDRVRKRIQEMYPESFKDINEIAYQTGNVTWLHLTHPSKGNGHLKSWLEGDPKNPSGRKREIAIFTVRHFIFR